MIKIQDTLNRTIELYGPEILKKKKNLCMLIEDLSPQLTDELTFITDNYDDRFGTLLFDAYTAESANKNEIIIEADTYLKSQKGLNEDWRNKVWLYFGQIAGKPPMPQAVDAAPVQTKSAPPPNQIITIKPFEQIQLYKKSTQNIRITGYDAKCIGDTITKTLRNSYCTAMLLTDDDEVLIELLAGSYVMSFSRFDANNIKSFSENLTKMIFCMFIKANNLKSNSSSTTIVDGNLSNVGNTSSFRYSGENGVLNCISSMNALGKVVIVSGAFAGLDNQFLSEILGKDYKVLQRFFVEQLCRLFSLCDYFDNFKDNSEKYSELKRLLSLRLSNISISKDTINYVYSTIKEHIIIDNQNVQKSVQLQKPASSPKFCIKCGSPLEKNAKFCIKCGYKL